MWVFGYGSLMWDGWEMKLGCRRRALATLHGYRRTFNKASVKNWGTVQAPCPTLNLEQDEAGVCKGVAFEFPNDRENEVLSYLRDREGKGFAVPNLRVRLDDGAEVEAHAPLYQGENLLPVATIREKAAKARSTAGSSGSCVEYVKGVAEKLSELGIDDPSVTELWQEIQADPGHAGKGHLVVRRSGSALGAVQRAKDYLAVVGIIGGISGWLYLKIHGCENPACRIIDVYKHRVETLEEYAQYVAGADLYTVHRASSLVFPCESLRDQAVRELHNSMVSDAPLGSSQRLRQLAESLQVIGARREGRNLHLMNDVTVGEEGLESWEQQLRAGLEKDPHDKRAGRTAAIIRRLFDAVVLHAGNREIVIHMQERFKCD